MVLCRGSLLHFVFRNYIPFGVWYYPSGRRVKVRIYIQISFSIWKMSSRTRVLAALQEVLLLLISAAGTIQILFSNNGCVVGSVDYIDGPYILINPRIVHAAPNRTV